MTTVEIADYVKYRELEGALKLVEVLLGKEVICVICPTDRGIEECIEESKRLGDYGEYGEHFAEICAHNFAYTMARQAYVHFYNSTGFIIHGGDYANNKFYVAQEAVYNYVLPIFKEKLNKVNA